MPLGTAPSERSTLVNGSPALRALVALAFCATVAATAADAAVIRTFDSNGRLTKAQNVDVGGTLYDVQFVVFPQLNGCSLSTGLCVGQFPQLFTTEADALLAGQALLDQVLLDVPGHALDTDVSLVNGCPSSSSLLPCQVLTFYQQQPSPLAQDNIAKYVYSNNTAGIVDPAAGSVTLTGFGNWLTITSVVAADWSRTPPVTTAPEPGSVVLLGTAVLGLLARRRRA